MNNNLLLTRKQRNSWVIVSPMTYPWHCTRLVVSKATIWKDFSHLSNRSEIQRITSTLLVHLYLLLFSIYGCIANVMVKHWRCCNSLRHESYEKSIYMVIFCDYHIHQFFKPFGYPKGLFSPASQVLHPNIQWQRASDTFLFQNTHTHTHTITHAKYRLTCFYFLGRCIPNPQLKLVQASCVCVMFS